MSDKRQKHSYIRGDRTHFRKREHIKLHTLPSAQAHEPRLVHSRPRRGFMHGCGRVAVFMLLFAFVVSGVAYFMMERGALDRFLLEKANEQVAASMPAGYHAGIQDASLRFGSDGKLNLSVAGVTIAGPEDRQIASVGTLNFNIDPLALIGGQIAVSSVSADKIDFDSAALPSTGTFRLSEYRVDRLPILIEQIFDRTDFVRGILVAAETQSIQFSNIAFPVGSASEGKTVEVDVRELNVAQLPDGVLSAEGLVALDGTISSLSFKALSTAGRTRSLQAELGNLELTPFLLRENSDGEPALGLEGTADVAIEMERATGSTAPSLKADVDIASGRFVADQIARPFSDAWLNLFYDNTKKSIELTNSSVDFEGSRFPFEGGIMDLDRIKPDADEGYALDFLVRGGRFKSREPGMPPLIFDAKFTGEYRGSIPRLLLDNVAVSSPQGMMAASFKAIFGHGSPELSIGARIERMDTEAVKQLWPFWIARKPREWVSQNLHGGVITNGDIAVFLPAGRLKGAGVPVNLDKNELNISFDINDTRITLNNHFPDVRNSDARVSINGPSVDVDIRDGMLNVKKAGTVTLNGGTFRIANTHQKPLMGEASIELAGTATDILSLAAAEPINALNGTGYAASDFSGTGRAVVHARFPLDKDDEAGISDWGVEADLENVAIAKPVSGYQINGLTGPLNVVPHRISFDGTGRVDGIPVDIDWMQPIGSGAGQKSALVVAGTLSNEEREKLVPGLGGFVNGPMTLVLNRSDDKSNIVLDLTRTQLMLPWIGWSKPSGEPATLSFDSTGDDGKINLSNLKLSGAGISASGEVRADKNGLSSASLTNVALSEGDDFNVAIEHAQSGFDVSITGRTLSVESMLDDLQQGKVTAGEKGQASGSDAHISIDLARVVGKGGRYLSGAKGKIVVDNGAVATASLNAKTMTGQPLSIDVGPDGGDLAVHLRTTGTGALLRFLGIYQKMSGGTANLDMIETGAGWRGMLNLSDFTLINDDQLKKLLSAPTGKNGESLNATYSNRIDARSQHFQRAQSVIDLSNGVLRITDTFVRGDQVGVTVKGVVRDAAGNIDLTGTFMPAYGLNRIFAEIPLFGPLLGNGQDKGLFGITFKLTGKTTKPDLVINPLSAIAPGVFRRIFEFQ